MTVEQIADRVRDLVANIELQARRTRTSLTLAGKSRGVTKAAAVSCAETMSEITVTLATELATLLGKGRLEVEDRREVVS